MSSISFYQQIPVCDQWLTLNYTKEKLLENGTWAYELYKFCSVNFANFPPVDCVVSTVRNRLYDMFSHDDEIRNPCSTFMDPILTMTGSAPTVAKKKYCISNSSVSWKCNDWSLSTIPDHGQFVRWHKYSDAVKIWVDRYGITQGEAFLPSQRNHGKCFPPKPLLQILPLTIVALDILARISRALIKYQDGINGIN